MASSFEQPSPDDVLRAADATDVTESNIASVNRWTCGRPLVARQYPQTLARQENAVATRAAAEIENRGQAALFELDGGHSGTLGRVGLDRGTRAKKAESRGPLARPGLVCYSLRW
jgi:hypothetical protein